MKTQLSFNMSKLIRDMASSPIRTKENAILLILHTINTLSLSNDYDNKANIIIEIKKMNRVFYIFEHKIFSMQFPFLLYENNLEKYGYEFVYFSIGKIIKIDSIIINFLIQVFELITKNNFKFQDFFDIITEFEYDEYCNGNFTIDDFIFLFLHLLSFDLGYIRYDADIEHENGKMHPLYHFNIFLDNPATFMAGLKNKIDFKKISDLLNLETECWYFN